MSNRYRLAETAANSRQGKTTGSHLNCFNVVYDLLMRIDVNLSDQSADTFMNDSEQVDAGKAK